MCARAGRTGKKPMAEILHAADFHLDSAYAGLTPERAKERRAESRAQLSAMVDYANDRGAELMLLAGDLFDGENVYAQTGEELSAALERFRGQVVIAPGNHDPYTPRSAYARLPWPENVHIFSSAQMETLAFPQYGCTVSGAAFTGEEMPAWEGFTAPGGVSIGLLHGEVGVRESKYRAVTSAQIKDSGFTYLAMGHVHRRTEVETAGGTAWAYPGCPEGRGFDEPGDKGFYFGEVSEEGVKLEFVPFARHRYEFLTVDVTDTSPREALERSLPMDTERDSYRVIFTGETNKTPDIAALTEEFAPRFYSLALRDRTTLRRDLWERIDDDSLRGLFLRGMREKYDAAETEEERTKVERAVRFGLDAMDGRE